MAGSVVDYQRLQETKKGLLELLQENQKSLDKFSDAGGSFDIHHPERSPNWKRYVHQEYPKALYHPVQLDPVIENQREGIRRRNAANPNVAPLQMPPSEPLMRKVSTPEEHAQAEMEGFVSYPEVFDRAKRLREGEAIESGMVDPLANEEIAARITAPKARKQARP
jgi:hypothetical protein